jgi:hypothetical protein
MLNSHLAAAKSLLDPCVAMTTEDASPYILLMDHRAGGPQNLAYLDLSQPARIPGRICTREDHLIIDDG